jgi:hypothetical protein
MTGGEKFLAISTQAPDLSTTTASRSRSGFLSRSKRPRRQQETCFGGNLLLLPSFSATLLFSNCETYF